MNFVSFEISIAAAIPAVLLALYVFWKDKVEKEPIGLLAILFAVGGVSQFAAFYVEKLVVGLVDRLFEGSVTYSIQGLPTFSSPMAEYGHGFLVVFIGVALVEEVVKWAVMFFITFKNKHFNCLFDGIVYGTFVSLGFGLVENVRYAWLGGWDTLLIRSLTSVPGHLYFGVIMGYCYTMWRAHRSAAIAEKEYARGGLIQVEKPFRSWGWFVAMILLPILEHGVYGFAGYFQTTAFKILFYILNAIFFIACMLGVKRVSESDTYSGRYADYLLDRKYPETKEICDDVEEDLEEIKELIEDIIEDKETEEEEETDEK